jgi:hypothetical protein
MQLPLRKALRLRKQLETALVKVDLPLTADLPVLVAANRDRPEAAVAAGAGDLEARLLRQERLSGILRDLRIAIARENVARGVDELLARSAHVERLIALNKAVADAEPTPVAEQLVGEMGLAHDALKAVDRRGYDEPARKVTVSVVGAAMREGARARLATLRREREEIEDARLEANAGRGIEIAEADVEVLRDAGIL